MISVVGKMAYNRRVWKREAVEEEEEIFSGSSTPIPTLDPNVDRAKVFRQHHHHRVTTSTQASGNDSPINVNIDRFIIFAKNKYTFVDIYRAR